MGQGEKNSEKRGVSDRHGDWTGTQRETEKERGGGWGNKEGEGERTNKFRHGKDRLIQNDQQETNQKKQTKRLNLLERHREKQERKRNGC